MVATYIPTDSADAAVMRLFMGDPEARANPVPFYHEMRDFNPVYHRIDPFGGQWHLTRYDDVALALKDPRFSSRGQFTSDAALQQLPPEQRERAAYFGEYASKWMVTNDPPDHTRLRGLVMKAFTPRVVESLRPHIQEIVDGLLDDAAERGEMETIADFAFPLPATVIAELLSVPTAERDLFRQWTRSLVEARNFDSETRFQDFRDMVAYFHAAAQARVGQPGDDLLSNLVRVREANDALFEGELVAQAVLLLVAGHETTTNLIGNGLLALLRHPDQLRLLTADATLLPNAVEELLRYDSPVQFLVRTVREAVEIGGHVLPAGDMVFFWLGAANHDPGHFVEPDALNFARSDAKSHLSFAHGIHFCIGSALARMEGQVALGTLLRRFPQVRPQAGFEAQFCPNFSLRGLVSLPVTLT